MQGQRDLADQGEASRFAELRSVLESRLLKLEGDIVESQIRVQMQREKLEENLRSTVEHAGNTLAVYRCSGGSLEQTIGRARAGSSA